MTLKSLIEIYNQIKVFYQSKLKRGWKNQKVIHHAKTKKCQTRITKSQQKYLYKKKKKTKFM